MAVIELICPFGPEHVHEFPDDWRLGGASGTDPRADERFSPTTYTYFDNKLQILHFTQVPVCDDEAIDYFTSVASWGAGFNPVWVQATRPDGTVETLPVEYEKATDIAWER